MQLNLIIDSACSEQQKEALGVFDAKGGARIISSDGNRTEIQWKELTEGDVEGLVSIFELAATAANAQNKMHNRIGQSLPGFKQKPEVICRIETPNSGQRTVTLVNFFS